MHRNPQSNVNCGVSGYQIQMWKVSLFLVNSRVLDVKTRAETGASESLSTRPNLIRERFLLKGTVVLRFFHKRKKRILYNILKRRKQHLEIIWICFVFLLIEYFLSRACMECVGLEEAASLTELCRSYLPTLKMTKKS